MRAERSTMGPPDRLRGVALVASAILVLVFFALHPRFEDPADNAAVFRAIAAAGTRWQVAQTCRLLAWLLILVGVWPAGDGWVGRVGYAWTLVGAAFQLAHGGFEVALHLVEAPWL